MNIKKNSCSGRSSAYMSERDVAVKKRLTSRASSDWLNYLEKGVHGHCCEELE